MLEMLDIILPEKLFKPEVSVTISLPFPSWWKSPICFQDTVNDNSTLKQDCLDWVVKLQPVLSEESFDEIHFRQTEGLDVGSSQVDFL